MLSFSFALAEAERLEENPLCSDDYLSQTDVATDQRSEGRVEPPPETEGVVVTKTMAACNETSVVLC